MEGRIEGQTDPIFYKTLPATDGDPIWDDLEQQARKIRKNQDFSETTCANQQKVDFAETKIFCWLLWFLKYIDTSRPIPDEEKKIKLNIYFHTSLWWLHKTFWGTIKKCENKNLT